MWTDYIKERMPHKEILETEHGFAIYYNFEAENSLYIEDIYVKPEHRRTKVATELMHKLIDISKSRDFKYLLGSNDPTTVGATKSMQGMLNSDFKLYCIRDGLIFLRRENT